MSAVFNDVAISDIFNDVAMSDIFNDVDNRLEIFDELLDCLAIELVAWSITDSTKFSLDDLFDDM